VKTERETWPEAALHGVLQDFIIPLLHR